MENKNQRPLHDSNLKWDEINSVFAKVLKSSKLIDGADTALIMYDLTMIEDRINTVKQVFPPSALHAVAMKANPLIKIVSKLKSPGVGMEVASLPELYLAEKAGFAPENIVFDSPCKTREEIEYALRSGIYINADSLDELHRIGEIFKTTDSGSKMGLRINPQVGTGSIKSTSVAGTISKFGVPLLENRQHIIDNYLKYKWLKGIHVHIGSQGCPVPLLIEGIRKVLDLALEINLNLVKESESPITVFDIGGGLPVSYYADKTLVTMSQYYSMLKETCPELFTGEFRLITEFGRYIHANAGWVAAKVEYVKRENGYNIIITHVGADLFLRKCYNPGDWHHEISVADKYGNLKSGTDSNKYIVAGPLCFAGDVLATDLELPEVVEGDYILIRDTGAYTLCMWSRYNSRQIPQIIGYRTENDTFEVLKERERPDNLLDFWQ